MKHLKHLIAALLCLCMALTLLPTAALADTTAAATVKYINAADNAGTTEYSFADAKSANTVAVFVYGGTAEGTTYTYTTGANVAGLLLFINNAAVTVSGDMPSEFRLAGTGSLTKSGVTATTGSYTTPFGDDPETISNVVGFFTSDDITNAVYSYTVAESTSLSDFLTAYDLTVSSGAALTVNAPTAGANQPEFYRLTIKNSLTVNGTLTADAGQVLEIGASATVTGLPLYYSDGTHTYTIPIAQSVDFSYSNLDKKWESAETVPTYTITASATTNGSISPSGNNTVAQGDSNAFTVTADSGCVISTLTVDGSSISEAANQSAYTYTFSNVTKAHTIAAAFIQVHTITASAGEHGSISPSGSVAVVEGADPAFTFTPISGYHVDTVTVDGESAGSNSNYTFRNVTSDHSISVSFAQDNGNDPPFVDTPNYAGAKTGIESRHWAYYTLAGTAAAMKTAFSAELWDMLDHEYPGVFADSDAAADAVTLSAEIATDNAEINGIAYYTFTVELGENDASGKTYVLDAANKFVVRTTVGSTNTFTVVTKPTSGDAVLVKEYDADGIEVFGNYVAAVGTLGRTDSSVAYHVTPHITVADAISCTLVVYKPTFAGAKLTRGSTNGKAAAWDFGSYPMAAFGASQAAPAEFRTYFGDGSVTLAVPSADGIAISAITGVSATLPEGAVTITNNGGAFTVAFHSNFYDQVPLTVTYTDSTGASKTGYLLIKRVGIDIQDYRKAGGASNNDLTLFHGTQSGTTYTDFYAENACGVFATFYYPANNDEQVELAATYTWADGSVTRETISSHNRTDADNVFVAADDFQLYAGTTAGLPVKIEVTAVKTGSDADSFAGASLGSSAGVVWERPDSLQD